jgi:hypothetical protein
MLDLFPGNAHENRQMERQSRLPENEGGAS